MKGPGRRGTALQSWQSVWEPFRAGGAFPHMPMLPTGQLGHRPIAWMAAKELTAAPS